jgi:CBS domain-containing protein
MSRTDDHLDAMLRHLGAAYYESLHGRAARSDVTRALDTVEEHLGENAPEAGAQSPVSSHPAGPAGGPGHSRWARRVSDVMTTSVVTVDRLTPYQDIARLLAQHKISGVPVLRMGRHVAGVVSESDLLAAEDKPARQARLNAQSPRRWRLRQPRRTAMTAGALMTAPAITVHPDMTVPGAARLMNTHHVRRLPVVDAQDKLAGIVSRRDLLSVFLRPDADVARDARQVLEELPLTDPEDVTVMVRHGVVTLTGTLESASQRYRDLVAVALRLIWDIDGVVDVVSKLGQAVESRTA